MNKERINKIRSILLELYKETYAKDDEGNPISDADKECEELTNDAMKHLDQDADIDRIIAQTLFLLNEQEYNQDEMFLLDERLSEAEINILLLQKAHPENPNFKDIAKKTLDKKLSKNDLNTIAEEAKALFELEQKHPGFSFLQQALTNITLFKIVEMITRQDIPTPKQHTQKKLLN